MTTQDVYCLLNEEIKPSTFQEVVSDSNASLWMTTMWKKK